MSRALLTGLLLIVVACVPPVTHDLSGSVDVFDFTYHSDLIIEQAQRLAGGDYYGLAEEERDAVWVDAAGLVRGTPCGEGLEPFPAVHDGALLQVMDAVGTVIAAGPLSAGFVDLLPYPDVQAKVIAVCRFEFDIVLPDAANYTLRVADRPLANFAKEQLEAANWSVSLELGVQR